MKTRRRVLGAGSDAEGVRWEMEAHGEQRALDAIPANLRLGLVRNGRTDFQQVSDNFKSITGEMDCSEVRL